MATGMGLMEKDNDIAGDHYDFGARIYDGRIGKWLSVDPLSAKYPNEAPYIFAGSSPIFMLDKLGEIKETIHMQYDAKTGIYTVLKVTHSWGLKRVITTEWRGSTLAYFNDYYDYQTYKVTVINGKKGGDYSKYTNLSDQTFGKSKYHSTGDDPFTSTWWAEMRIGEYGTFNETDIPLISNFHFRHPDAPRPFEPYGSIEWPLMRLNIFPLINALGESNVDENKQVEINSLTIGEYSFEKIKAKEVKVDLRQTKKEVYKKDRDKPEIIIPEMRFDNLHSKQIEQNINEKQKNRNYLFKEITDKFEVGKKITPETQLGFR